MARWIVVACVLMGCHHAYVSASYDTTSKVHGPLANLVSAPIAARTTGVAAAEAPVAPSGNSYSLAVGGGVRDFTIELAFHAHEIADKTFALPDPATINGTPHYITGSTSLDMRLTWLRTHHISTNVHVGPAAMLMLDRTTGSVEFGQGFRYGGAVAVSFSKMIAYVDLYRTGILFADGPATGFSDVSGVAFGLAYQK